MRLRHLWFALLLSGVGASDVLAHPVAFSYIDINITPAGTDVFVSMHPFDVAHDLGLASEAQVLDANFAAQHGRRLTAIILSRLRIQYDGTAVAPTPSDVAISADGQSVVLRLRYPVSRVADLHLAGWLFPYDALHQTFIKVYDDGRLTTQDILTATRPAAAYHLADRQTRLAVVGRFVRSGLEHIAIGPDHVLFLIGLLLLGGNVWQIVRIVTGFTVAHSITLSLAVLGVVTPPAKLIEPAIALSICYVGITNLVARPGARDTRAWVAFAFGFVHGFGFASVLAELGLPRYALGWSLFGFNLGVEIGQLIIVLVVSSLLAWIARTQVVLRRRITIAGSVVVIWAGFFWFVERVFFT